jgi:hypothetical protein
MPGERGADSWRRPLGATVSWLNWCWSSPAHSFLSSALVEINDQPFYLLLDMQLFRNGPPHRQGEGSVFLYRLCICCAAVIEFYRAGKLLLVSSAQLFLVPSPARLMTIFYCFRFETPPTLRTRSLYLYAPVTRVAQIYSQTPASYFVAAYDSQGCGGGILTHHTGLGGVHARTTHT